MAIVVATLHLLLTAFLQSIKNLTCSLCHLKSWELEGCLRTTRKASRHAEGRPFSASPPPTPGSVVWRQWPVLCRFCTPLYPWLWPSAGAASELTLRCGTRRSYSKRNRLKLALKHAFASGNYPLRTELGFKFSAAEDRRLITKTLQRALTEVASLKQRRWGGGGGGVGRPRDWSCRSLLLAVTLGKSPPRATFLVPMTTSNFEIR